LTGNEGETKGKRRDCYATREGDEFRPMAAHYGENVTVTVAAALPVVLVAVT